MRRLRKLASLALATSLVGLPALALGQSTPEATNPTTPLALAPDGQLPLQGTPWRLRGYRFRGIDRAPGPEVAAWMRLGPYDVEASGGCTRVKGRYGVVGSAISFRLRGLKENDCAEQTTMVQLAMVDGLRKAAGYEIVPGEDPGTDELVLRSATGIELLRFGLDDIDALDLADWLLTSYTRDGEVIPAVADQTAVLSFQATRDRPYRRVSSGPMTGSTGCNGVIAEFYRHADVLSFSPLERTDAPCASALAAQEEAIVSVLDATALMLSLPPDHLTLTSVDTGDTLQFVSQRPLEGSTWLLEPGPRTANPGGAVTLRLDGGSATGEGPCGPYRAGYVTDGFFITFFDIEGSGDDICAEVKSERALLSSLRSAVRLDRDQPQLRMLDAFGLVTVRLAQPSGP